MKIFFKNILATALKSYIKWLLYFFFFLKKLKKLELSPQNFRYDVLYPLYSAKTQIEISKKVWNGILLPKLFWPTVRKKCSCDREKFLKFEAEGREFSNFLRSLKQFIQTVKGQNNFWQQCFFNLFLEVSQI